MNFWIIDALNLCKYIFLYILDDHLQIVSLLFVDSNLSCHVNILPVFAFLCLCIWPRNWSIQLVVQVVCDWAFIGCSSVFLVAFYLACKDDILKPVTALSFVSLDFEMRSCHWNNKICCACFELRKFLFQVVYTLPLVLSIITSLTCVSIFLFPFAATREIVLPPFL